MGVEKLSKRFRGRICFWGEVDRQSILPNGTPDEVRQAAKEVVDNFLTPNGGFIGQAEVNEDVPLENVEALLKAWRDFGNL